MPIRIVREDNTSPTWESGTFDVLGIVKSWAHRKAFTAVTFGANTGVGTHQLNNSGFANVEFSTLYDYAINDTYGNWDTTDNYYLCPVTGVYRLTMKLRVIDGVTASSSYGIGAGLWSGNPNGNEGDTATFMWTETTSLRNGAENIILRSFTAGDTLCMWTYADISSLYASDGYFAIELMYGD